MKIKLLILLLLASLAQADSHDTSFTFDDSYILDASLWNQGVAGNDSTATCDSLYHYFGSKTVGLISYNYWLKVNLDSMYTGFNLDTTWGTAWVPLIIDSGYIQLRLTHAASDSGVADSFRVYWGRVLQEVTSCDSISWKYYDWSLAPSGVWSLSGALHIGTDTYADALDSNFLSNYVLSSNSDGYPMIETWLPGSTWGNYAKKFWIDTTYWNYIADTATNPNYGLIWRRLGIAGDHSNVINIIGTDYVLSTYRPKVVIYSHYEDPVEPPAAGHELHGSKLHGDHLHGN